MTTNRDSWRYSLAALVIVHFAISVVHGHAHDQAEVALSQAGMLFVFVVILGGPVAGLALLWPAPLTGTMVIAGTMAGSLVFGVVNHFIIAGPDRVDYVVAHARTLFEVTALMLVLSEAAGSVIGFSYGRSRRTDPSYIPHQNRRLT